MSWLKKHDVIMKVFCVLFAFFLWLYVVSTQNPDVETNFKNIPVTLTNAEFLAEKYGLVVVSGEDSKVDIRLGGKRDQIFKIGNSDNITATVDLSGITEAGTHRMYYECDFPASGVDVVGRTPNYITLTVEKLETMTIPVKAEVTGKPENGYYIEECTVSPESITVIGPASEIAPIAAATVTVDAKGLSKTESWSLDYKFVGANQKPVLAPHIVNVSENSVLTTLKISKTKNIPLNVEVITDGEFNVSYEISPSYVTAYGDEEALMQVNQISLGSVDVSDMDEEYSVTLPVKLPDGVKSADGVSEAVITVHKY